MIKVFITDDHTLVIDGLTSILSSSEHIEVIGSALTGEDTLEQLKTLEVDVLLLDINLPGMDGIEVAKELLESAHPVRIVALTMHESPQFTKRMIELGVKGFLLKNSGKKEVIDAIKKVHGGNRAYSPEVTEALFDSIDKSRKAVEKVELTKRELEVLKHIVDGLTTPQIADELFISHHTVETHRKNLLSKVGVKNSAELVKFAVTNDLHF